MIDARRFGGHVAVLSDRHADRGGHHGRGVVDAIPHMQCFGGGGFRADDGELSSGLFCAWMSVMPTCSAR